MINGGNNDNNNDININLKPKVKHNKKSGEDKNSKYKSKYKAITYKTIVKLKQKLNSIKFQAFKINNLTHSFFDFYETYFEMLFEERSEIITFSKEINSIIQNLYEFYNLIDSTIEKEKDENFEIESNEEALEPFMCALLSNDIALKKISEDIIEIENRLLKIFHKTDFSVKSVEEFAMYKEEACNKKFNLSDKENSADKENIDYSKTPEQMRYNTKTKLEMNAVNDICKKLKYIKRLANEFLMNLNLVGLRVKKRITSTTSYYLVTNKKDIKTNPVENSDINNNNAIKYLNNVSEINSSSINSIESEYNNIDSEYNKISNNINDNSKSVDLYEKLDTALGSYIINCKNTNQNGKLVLTSNTIYKTNNPNQKSSNDTSDKNKVNNKLFTLSFNISIIYSIRENKDAIVKNTRKLEEFFQSISFAQQMKIKYINNKDDNIETEFLFKIVIKNNPVKAAYCDNYNKNSKISDKKNDISNNDLYLIENIFKNNNQNAVNEKRGDHEYNKDLYKEEISIVNIITQEIKSIYNKYTRKSHYESHCGIYIN